MSTLTVYPVPGTTADGMVGANGYNEAWSTLRGRAGNQNSGAETMSSVIRFLSTTTSNQWGYLNRGIFCFTTSALGSGATISGATIGFTTAAKRDTLGITPDVNVYDASPASTSSLANTDYANVGTTAYCDTPISYSNWAANYSYNTFTLNASGISNINKIGVSVFGVRNANYDASNSAPTWGYSVESSLDFVLSRFSGTDYDPKLVVTYTVAAGPTNMKTWNSVAKASIKTMNGVAIASVKTWNGVN